MIVKIGDIFESKAKTLVNTVNCVGVMGKGIAQEFKKRYPQMFEEYVSMCKEGEVKPGIPYYYEDLLGNSILNFPTKNHWRSPSKLSYIVTGLNWFKENYQLYGITSIAFPPLGCGNGGLPWKIVGPIMYSVLKDIPINIEMYAPYGTAQEQLTFEYLESNLIESTKDVFGTKGLSFNKYWLLILYVVQKLNHDKYSLSVGRTIFQKICYILTRVGIPTGFNFVEGNYGPYSNDVKEAIITLSNANYMTERQLGKMVETVVTPSFKLPDGMFTDKEIALADQAFDLMSRIKSTDQAELVATVLFSYDGLRKKEKPTEQQVYDHVLEWKPRWRVAYEQEVKASICELSALGWMQPRTDCGMLEEEDLV